MTPVFLFLIRHWQAVLGGLAVLSLATLLAIRTDQRDDARAGLDAERQAHILFAERVRAKAEEMGRRALERARRVEAEQQRINQENEIAYRQSLAELRARYDRLVRERAGGENPGRAGGAFGLSPLPDPARRADGAAEPDGLSLAAPELALAERLLCSEQSLRLSFLQRWINEQAGIDRSAPDAEASTDREAQASE